jgi:tetratricopeptide (TPR) repeat protein
VIVVAHVGQMEFDYALLREATGLDDEKLLGGVEQLLIAGLLLEPRSRDRRELILSHAAYGEVAYETLPLIRRRALHAAVARALRATEANPLLMASALATHYEIAGQPGEASAWWLRAGDGAHARYAHVEALAMYERALALQGGHGAAIWERIGRLHRRYLGRYAEGIEAYERAVAGYRQERKWAAAVRAYCELAECRREMGAYIEAAAAAEAGLSLAETSDAGDDLLALTHVRLSNALRSGQLAPLTEIRAHLETALDLAARAGADLYAAEARFWLGVLAYNDGDPQRALKHVKAALPAFRCSGEVGWETMALNNLAYYALRAGQPEAARVWAAEGLVLAQRASTVNSEIWLLATLGQIHLHQGNLGDAEATLQQGLALASAHGPERLRIGFHHLLALVALACRRWDVAVELIGSVLSLAEQARPQHMAELHIALARAYLGQAAYPRAAAEAEVARQIAVAKAQRSREAQAWRVLGQVAAAEGRATDAKHAFEHSLALLEATGDRLERARTLAAWGQWQRKQSDAETPDDPSTSVEWDGGGWTAPQLLTTNPGPSPRVEYLQMSRDGMALYYWLVEDSVQDLYLIRWGDEGWGSPQRINDVPVLYSSGIVRGPATADSGATRLIYTRPVTYTDFTGSSIAASHLELAEWDGTDWQVNYLVEASDYANYNIWPHLSPDGLTLVFDTWMRRDGALEVYDALWQMETPQPPVDPLLPTTTTSIIPPSGGALYSPVDTTSYEVPPGTFTATVHLTHTCQTAPVVPPPPGWIDVGHIFSATAVVSDTGQPVQPTGSITITISYTDLARGPVIPGSLRLWRLVDGVWVPVPSVDDADRREVVGQVDVLSGFAVFGESYRVFLPLVRRN